MPERNELLLFKALGEETKYMIIELLMKVEHCGYAPGEYCACEIPTLIKRAQSNTSMHLAKLQEWGIIKSRREGRKILYSIKDERVAGIFDLIEGWSGRVK
jgi:ArsR family transcriptional regulator